MTEHPPGTGLPGEPVEEPFGPETPGPDASPEQEAFVVGLLGSLRDDDPAIPDHVAARVDGVLAELRRSEPVGAGRATGLGDADDGPAPSRGADASSTATVLPLSARRRESGTTRTFRWVAGAAAAIVVVGAGAAVVRGGLSGSGTTGNATSMAEDASGGPGEKAAAPIRTSGTDYTSTALAAQALSLVAGAAGEGTAGPQVPAGGDPSTAPPAVDSARGLLTADTLAGCLEQLTGAPGATPVAVDQGSFEGKPADVVVLPSPDDPTRLEVWVIGPGCTRENAQLYEFRTIASPDAPSLPAAPDGTAAPTGPATEPSSAGSP